MQMSNKPLGFDELDGKNHTRMIHKIDSNRSTKIPYSQKETHNIFLDNIQDYP